jgi:solute:Na+ symporter, SSS family
VAAYVIVLIAISTFFIKKSVASYEEYTIASKSLGFIFTFFTYFSTWISGATILGLATISFEWGLYQYWFIAVTYIMGAVSGPIFLTRIRELNVMTIGDFFALRYPKEEKLVRLLVSISMLTRNVSIIGAQITTIAFFVSLGFGIQFTTGLILTTILIVFYTSLSGMWGVAGTDVIQGIIQIIGLPIMIFYVVQSAGGLTGIYDFYQQIGGSSYLNIFSGPSKTAEIALLFVAPGFFFLIEDQTTWQRVQSAKSVKVAFWGYLAPLGAALLWILVPALIGVFSKAIFPNFTAYPVAFLDYVLQLPKGVGLAIMFAIISACFSTCDSYLLSSGVIFSQDIVRNIFSRDKHLIFFTRVGILLTGLLSLYFSTKIYDIFELYMLGAYAGGAILTVPYLMTWFSKRANGKGIIAGMLLGTFSFGYLCWILNMGYSYAMMIGMFCNFVGIVFVSSFFAAPSAEAIEATYYFSKRFKGIKNIP